MALGFGVCVVSCGFSFGFSFRFGAASSAVLVLASAVFTGILSRAVGTAALMSENSNCCTYGVRLCYACVSGCVCESVQVSL